MDLRTYPRLVATFQFVFGLILVATLWHFTLILLSSSEQHRLPEGWSTIRPPAEVCTMLIVGDQLWAGGKDGLTIIDRSLRSVIPKPTGQPRFSRVWALLLDQHHSIWVGHDRGLALFKDGKWHIVNTGFHRIFSLLELADGRLLAGSDAGVAEYSGGIWHLLKMPSEHVLPSYDILFEDDNQTLWFGSNHPNRGGLISFDGTRWLSYAVGENLPHPSVNAITESSDGSLWVAAGFANRGGTARFFDGTWTMMSTADGLSGEKVRSIFEDKAGNLWFGSEYNGMAVLAPDGGWTYLRPEDGLSGREIKITLEDQDGYWLGTDGGLTFILRTQ